MRIWNLKLFPTVRYMYHWRSTQLPQGATHLRSNYPRCIFIVILLPYLQIARDNCIRNFARVLAFLRKMAIHCDLKNNLFSLLIRKFTTPLFLTRISSRNPGYCIEVFMEATIFAKELLWLHLNSLNNIHFHLSPSLHKVVCNYTFCTNKFKYLMYRLSMLHCCSFGCIMSWQSRTPSSAACTYLYKLKRHKGFQTFWKSKSHTNFLITLSRVLYVENLTLMSRTTKKLHSYNNPDILQ